jgi:phenylglyoxylate dehydrogenase epsilon subunit
VLVDEHMRTNVANIWAAGDVAQARGFFTPDRIINGILPDAVDQGRIAGMAMADDPGTKDYAGGVPLNTYSFFGQHAVSVGVHEGALEQSGVEVQKQMDAGQNRYLKIVLKDRRLAGIFGVNAAFDPGIMWELIRRAIDIMVKSNPVADPEEKLRRAIEIVGKFRSGKHDIAKGHDKYLADAYRK